MFAILNTPNTENVYTILLSLWFPHMYSSACISQQHILSVHFIHCSFGIFPWPVFFSPLLLSYMLPPILSLTPSFISNSAQVFRFLTLSPHGAKLLCSLPENYFLFHLVPLAFISCGVSSQAAAGAVNWLKATEGTKKIIRLSCNSWNF